MIYSFVCLFLSRSLSLSLPYPGDFRHRHPLQSVQSLWFSLFGFQRICLLSFHSYCMPWVIVVFPFLCFTIRLLMVFRCCIDSLPACFCMHYVCHCTSYPSSSTCIYFMRICYRQYFSYKIYHMKYFVLCEGLLCLLLMCVMELCADAEYLRARAQW